MPSNVRSLLLSVVVVTLPGWPTACGTAAEPPIAAEAKPTLIGYDLRRIRPREGEALSHHFERMREQALGEHKIVAVLFTADWCDKCRQLATELGNHHPPEAIDHVRILELNEEEWEAADRMDEFNGLRRRWDPPIGVYPLFVILDDAGGRREEMREAIARLESLGLPPSLSRWLESVRPAT